jgi:hypothetical protein
LQRRLTHLDVGICRRQNTLTQILRIGFAANFLVNAAAQNVSLDKQIDAVIDKGIKRLGHSNTTKEVVIGIRLGHKPNE